MSNNVIFLNTLGTSQQASNSCIHLSIESWKHYAKKYNYEIFILDQPFFERDVLPYRWYKIYVLDLLEQNDVDYSKVLYIDTNTLVHSNAPDIFKLVGEEFAGVKKHGAVDKILSEIEIYSKHAFQDDRLPFYKFLDTSLMLLNKTHLKVFKELQQFYFNNKTLIEGIKNRYNIGDVDPIINFFINKLPEPGCKIIPYEWNMQDMRRFEILTEDYLHTRYGYVSNYVKDVDSLDEQLMESTYRFLFNS